MGGNSEVINYVQVESFKMIKNETFHLGQFNIFVGANNSGKSSVLQAIQFAVGTAQTSTRFVRGKSLDNTVIKFTANTTSFVYLPINDIEALIHDRALTQTQGSSIYFRSDGAGNTKIELKRGKNRNITVSMENSQLLRQLMSSQPYCVITPGVSGISISEDYKARAAVLKSATRGDSNFYLRNILLLLKRQDKAWYQFNEKFHRFFPEYLISVDFDENINEMIEVSVTMPNGISLPIDALGTSALQIVQILSYIYCFDPQMIILDEPDTHLHPNNQRKLISTLNDISNERNLQILLSTHSRHIIDEATGIANFFWMQSGTVYKEISDICDSSIIQIMLDLGALDKSDFLRNPTIKWIICTEDARVDKDIMLKTIFKSSGFNLDECIILPYNGCTKIDSVVLLTKFIHQFLPNTKIIVHRDRDFLSEETILTLKNKFQRNGIYLWVTPTVDIEAIFINAWHIQALYPELDFPFIETIINDARIETREDTLKRFVNYVSTNSPEAYPNYREINLECEQKYDANPEIYSFGKKTLGIIKQKIQHELHKNPQLVVESQILSQPELRDLLAI